MIYLSTTYLGNVQYFSKLAAADSVHLEQHENYQKQSYRNRCVIMSGNGLLKLVIPIQKEHGNKMPIREVKIDYRENWQQNHWRAIYAAYRSSPFFEYYADDIRPFYEQQYERLFDYNLRLTTLLLELLQLNVEIRLTDSHAIAGSADSDYRQNINPKERLAKPDPLFAPQAYFQVFSQRFGFSSNLSIVDLLFNEGPDSLQLLKAYCVS